MAAISDYCSSLPVELSSAHATCRTSWLRHPSAPAGPPASGDARRGEGGAPLRRSFRAVCAWEIGVDAAILVRCAKSGVPDVSALRIPPKVSLDPTSADWQGSEVRPRRPCALGGVMPAGPEFAEAATSFPTGAPKDFDVTCVAARHPRKRHDGEQAGAIRTGSARPRTGNEPARSGPRNLVLGEGD